MPIYQYECRECETYWEVIVPYSQRDSQPCPACTSLNVETLLAAPTVLRASYRDGHKRKGWQDLREANKLVREKALARGDQNRREIANEIKRIGVKVEK